MNRREYDQGKRCDKDCTWCKGRHKCYQFKIKDRDEDGAKEKVMVGTSAVKKLSIRNKEDNGMKEEVIVEYANHAGMYKEKLILDGCNTYEDKIEEVLKRNNEHNFRKRLCEGNLTHASVVTSIICGDDILYYPDETAKTSVLEVLDKMKKLKELDDGLTDIIEDGDYGKETDEYLSGARESVRGEIARIQRVLKDTHIDI